MSQFNAPTPPPPGATPPNYGQPMGYGPPQASRMSVSALMSMICGILGCIPVITSLIALILGVVGLKATSKPGVTGKGFAIAGLILGVIGLLGWAGFGATVYYGWQQAKVQMAEQARPFVDAVVAGDVSKASAFSAMTEDEVTQLKTQMEGWGKVTEMSMSGFNFSKSASQPNTLVMNGKITFEKAGQKQFEITLDTAARGGPPKIIGVEFK